MKKFTKVLFTAAAVSLLCFAGCKNASDALGEEFISYTTHADKSSGAEATAYIDYTNEDSEIKRGLLFFNNKKKDIAMNVVMENPENTSGFMSVIFNKTENENGTLNFIALGYNSNAKDNKARMACTYYKNVSTADFALKNFNRPKDDCIELMPNKDTDGFYDSSIAPKNGKLTVGFVITAKKGETPYEVRVYENKSAAALKEIANKLSPKDNDEPVDVASVNSTYGEPILNFDIGIDDLGINSALDKRIEAGIGFYANVYAGKTLKGEWQVADISHNPDGIIWEDEIPNTLNIQLAE